MLFDPFIPYLFHLITQFFECYSSKRLKLQLMSDRLKGLIFSIHNPIGDVKDWSIIYKSIVCTQAHSANDHHLYVYTPAGAYL